VLPPPLCFQPGSWWPTWSTLKLIFMTDLRFPILSSFRIELQVSRRACVIIFAFFLRIGLAWWRTSIIPATQKAKIDQVFNACSGTVSKTLYQKHNTKENKYMKGLGV
jgi:hypothetical protein